MFKNMFKITMLLILLSVSCGPTPSSNKENKQETKTGCVSWGKITATNPIGISEYDKNGKEIFQEYLIKESGASLYIGSYAEECLITIDGHIASIDEIKIGMIVKLFSNMGAEESFPATLHHVCKIEAYTNPNLNEIKPNT